ncbi:uncharacterized protein LOC62_04G006155 [Vanrija pseudolonga]|uniref:Uncharacterized protein n=1 Tax=Vanrija pseudolonga TaxID=143232 RepID=A0AAF0YA12_9TREE|nr:hypothetical protein LOC62_04G006155 [Vanrija pseudolonga]
MPASAVIVQHAAHTPLSGSPLGSPSLRPVASTLSPDEPRGGRSATQTQRPYFSPRLQRSRSRPRGEIGMQSLLFAESVMKVVNSRRARAVVLGISPASPGGTQRETVEFVVDVPVWSAGCFSDLSTLHALRDKTLANVHGLINHLAEQHSVHATYKLLARRPLSVGWGCIRLVPSSLDDVAGTPCKHNRRTSFVKPEGSPHAPAVSSPRRPLSMSFEHAIVDEPEEEVEVDVKKGYSKESSDDEDEEEADSLVKAEVDKRGAKEGQSFVMVIHGMESLILV